MTGKEVIDMESESNEDVTPEAQQRDLDLTATLDGYWPSSKNITQ